MNSIPKALTAALVCGATLMSGIAEGQTKNVLTTVTKTVWNSDSVASSTNLKLEGGAYTFSAFFKIDPAKLWSKPYNSANADYRYAAKIVGIGNTMLGVYAYGDTTNLIYRIRPGNTTYTYGLCAAPLDGAWHHAVLTMNNKALVFYLDGVSVYTGTAGGAASTENLVTMIVNRGTYGSQSGGFGGSLAEVSI